MEMELMFERDFARISYDAVNNLMYLELLGVIGSQEYRETFNTLLQKAAEKGIKKLLVNQSTLQKSNMESKAWLVTSWVPKAKKVMGEDVKTALILSKNLFTKIGGEYVLGAVKTFTRFDMKAFSNFEDAKNWLAIDK